MNFGFTIGVPPLPAKKSTDHSNIPQALPPRSSSRKTPQAQQASSRKIPPQSVTAIKAATTRENGIISTPETRNDKPGRVGNGAEAQFQAPRIIGKRKRGAGKTVQEQEEDELDADDEGHRTSGKKTFVTPIVRSSPAAQGGSVEQIPHVEEGVDELEEADADHTISSNGTNAQSSPHVLLSANRSAPRHVASGSLTPISLIQQTSQQGRISTPFIDPRIIAAQNSATKASVRDQENRSNPSSTIASTRRTISSRTPLAPIANMLPLPSASVGLSTPRNPTVIMKSISPLFEANEHPDAEGTTPEISSNIDVEGETDEDPTPVVRAKLSTKPTTSSRSASKKTRKEARMSTQRTPKLKSVRRPQAHHSQKPRKSSFNPRLNANTESRPKKTSERITVPITVYKPTELEKLYAYSSVPRDADPLGADPVPSLNPVDVLAQITTEITTQFIRSYDNDGDGNGRTSDGLRRRQKAAVSKFHRCLQDSLFAMTAAASTVTALGSRVKKVKKRRVALQEELMQLRRERQDVGIEMDRVRAEYRRGMEVGEEQGELNQGLFDIESAVLRGRERARVIGRSDEGPDLGIVEIKERVVGGIGENGLLSAMRDMNAQLERATLVLEGGT